jgi:DNA-binding transcriptional ArsR family regulator
MNLDFVVGSPSVKKIKNVISVENYKYRAISIFMNEVPDIKFLSVASECLKALAHPVRLRVLFLLETERLTVGEIAKECDVVSHVASEHLRLMQRCGILSREKDGQKTYYQICESHVHAILDCMRNKFLEISPAQ